jgi:LmbE family N-acetylglucosaminyl deacetylase
MPQTLVTFHAHPDDAEIGCAGTMAKAKAEGHRVVLVIATRGELGERRPGTAGPAADLGAYREAETRAAAAHLGVDRVEFLGYRDSGMEGEPTNTAPDAFASADIDEAARRLARILDEEHASVLTTYDDHGGYGHPDHVQVHRVGVRAGELAATPAVFEQTANRDYIMRLTATQPDAFDDVPAEERPDPEFIATLGSPEALITTTVDVREYAERKREALAMHESQVGPESFFLAMPLDAFRVAFGYEWFIRRGAPEGYRSTSLFDDLDATT